ncbi:hypothetical protein C8R44DRAFT_744048 [Mycena epipterygia]|nr:hypothetical protein C8R44DRAFT_744048 [Mycena epipterygia]
MAKNTMIIGRYEQAWFGAELYPLASTQNLELRDHFVQNEAGYSCRTAFKKWVADPVDVEWNLEITCWRRPQAVAYENKNAHWQLSERNGRGAPLQPLGTCPALALWFGVHVAGNHQVKMMQTGPNKWLQNIPLSRFPGFVTTLRLLTTQAFLIPAHATVTGRPQAQRANLPRSSVVQGEIDCLSLFTVQTGDVMQNGDKSKYTTDLFFAKYTRPGGDSGLYSQLTSHRGK